MRQYIELSGIIADDGQVREAAPVHAPYYDQFYRGGLFNFSGYQLNQLVGREYGLGSLEYRRAVTYLTETLGTALYAGGYSEKGPPALYLYLGSSFELAH